VIRTARGRILLGVAAGSLRPEDSTAMSSKNSARRGSLTFDDVREIALSMPEVEETTAYGLPASRPARRASRGSRSSAAT